MKLDIAKRGGTLTFDKSHLIRKGAKTKLTFTCKTDPSWVYVSFTKADDSDMKRLRTRARCSLIQRLIREYENSPEYEKAIEPLRNDPIDLYEKSHQLVNRHVNGILKNYECDFEPLEERK